MPQIDHLIYYASNLERGMNEIESSLKVRPVLGGSHPDYGTHNALVSLGPTSYLEIMAPNPALQKPEQGVLFQEPGFQESRLITWAVRVRDIAQFLATSEANKLGLGPIQPGSREKPDGSIIRWHLTDPYTLPLGGAVPFLISWGLTPHPGGTAPFGGELTALQIEHPQPDRVHDALAVLGIDIALRKGQKTKLVAVIRTKHGIVEIG